MKYKIQVLLIGLILISIIEMLIDVKMVNKQIGLTLCKELKSLAGIVVATILMSAVVYFSITLVYSNLMKLVIGFLIGVISYIVICYVFNIANFKNELKQYAAFF